MELQSARDLKEELMQSLVAPLMSASTHALSTRRAATQATPKKVSALAMPLALAAAPMDQVAPEQRTMALGVSPGKTPQSFRLAVRVQRELLLESPRLQKLQKKFKAEIDVRYVGRIAKRAPVAIRSVILNGKQRPLLSGSSIGHFRVTAGTLGAFVHNAAGTIFVLSNNHVLANEDRAEIGDRILQPGKLDGGRARDRVGALYRSIRINKRSPNYVDCAICTLDDGVDYDTRLLGSTARAPIRLAGVAVDGSLDEGLEVHKIGRTTGVTKGRVTAFELDNVIVNFDEGNRRFDRQIEVEGSGRSSFCDGGDSGSLVLVGGDTAVGLLFAGSEVGGRNGRGLTFVNPISAVLSKLKVSLLD